MRVERILGRVNGFCGCEANKKKTKSKAPDVKTKCGQPEFVQGLTSVLPAKSTRSKEPTPTSNQPAVTAAAYCKPSVAWR